MVQEKSMFWEAPLLGAACWPAAELGLEVPSNEALDFIDAAMRRRLSKLTKISLWLAHRAAAGASTLRMVYASRHGELERTTNLLGALAADEALSPTAFSMSVLNTAPGLMSILRGDPAPTIAVSAGAETLAYGLLEAALQYAADPACPVLFVYADEPVPSVYAATDDDVGHAHGLAVCFGGNGSVTLSGCADAAAGKPSLQSQSQVFSKLFAGAESAHWEGPHNAWRWTRNCH